MTPFTNRKITREEKALHASMFRRMMRIIPKNKQEYQEKKVPFFFLVITLLVAALIVGKVTYTAYQYITHFEIKDLLNFLAADLEKDDEKRTNILLLGHGGGEHDGADLTDTIMIASLNEEMNRLSMVSIPRDLWLDLPGYGSSRINKIHDILKEKYGSEQSLDILREGVENITNLDVPYYFKVDFEGFKSIVDTLGGIDIEVEKSIYDPLYPDDQLIGYETFSLDAGLQTLDGDTALKYARSRHSTSDFDRARRQQKVIGAIKDKAEEQNLLGSPLLLKQLYEDFSEHLETNLSITELVSLARFAREFDRENIASAVLKDNDILDMGTFLYTPDREFYGGAFVLVPIGNSYQYIQHFIRLVFDFPEFFRENATVQILNGSGASGIAAGVGETLIPYGFNVQRYANADRRGYERSHYYIHNPSHTRVTESVLKQFFPNALKMTGEVPEGIDTDYDLSIVIGEDIDLEEFPESVY